MTRKRTPEADLMRLCTDWLSAEKIFWLRMNVVRGKLERGGYVNQGLKGQADILAIPSPNENYYYTDSWSDKFSAFSRYLIWLELKAKRGVQSDDQKAFESKVREEGHGYFVIRSLEDLKQALGR